MVHREFEDLTVDGSVQKHVMVGGDGDDVERGSKVSVRYVLKLHEGEDAPVIESSDHRKNGLFRFVVGRKKVIPMLEIAVLSMRQGEKSLVRSESSYAFGMKGLERKGIPGNAVVWMQVEIVSVEGGEKLKPIEVMSARERLDAAKTFKEKGNELFKGQKFEKAKTMYVKSIRYLTNVFYRPKPKEEESNHIHQPHQQQHNTKADDVQKPDENEQKHTVEPSTETPNPNITQEAGFEAAQVVTDTASPISVSHANGATTDVQQQVVEEVVDISSSSSPSPVVAQPEQAPVQDAQTNGTEHPVGSLPDDSTQGPEMEETEARKEEEEEEDDDDDDPEEKEVKTLHVTTLNNLALCLVKMENYRQAVEKASLALQIDQSSHKALYYRGRAKVFLGEWDDARADLVAATRLSDNPGIKSEIIKLDKKRKLHAEREKKQAAAMFA